MISSEPMKKSNEDSNNIFTFIVDTTGSNAFYKARKIPLYRDKNDLDQLVCKIQDFFRFNKCNMGAGE